jgi:hypothetical protein
MDTRNQIRANYRRLTGRVRGLDHTVRLVGNVAYALLDVFLFPIDWTLKLWLWGVHKWKEVPLPEELELLMGGLTRLQLDTAGAKGHAVSEAELNEIVKYGLEAFGEHDIDSAARQQMVKHFVSACPKAFMFLTTEKMGGSGTVLNLSSQGGPAIERQEKVGYTCVLPLKTSGYIAYRKGELSDYKFTECHITSPRYLSPPRYLCIQAFALCVRINKFHAKALLEGLAYHVSLHLDGIVAHRPVLIAEAATPSGLRLLERFAFAKIGQSANGVPLYELDTRHYENLPQRSKDTVLLLDAMVRQFAASRSRQRGPSTRTKA